MMELASRFLVILPNNLGDVIMASPVLEGLKAVSNGSYSAFIVEKGFEAGMEQNPHCDRLIAFDRRTIRDLLRSEHWEKGRGQFTEWLTVVNDLKIDAVINLCQHQYVGYLSGLIKANDRLGKQFLREGIEAVQDDWSQYLYAIPFARRYNRLHATDVYRRIAGVTQHRGGYTITLSADERNKAAALLSEIGFSSTGKMVVFQPGAAFPAKRWPVEHFILLGQMFINDGWNIVVSGAPSETEVCAAIAGRLGDACVSLAGTGSFRQALAVVSHARLCITGDTALMHGAAALGIKTCALFGATSPLETGPYGDNHWVLCGTCPDKPCFCESCKNMLCMKSILPQTVFSCAMHDEPGPNPRCEVFTTALQPDGDFSLIPTGADPVSYYNPAGALLTIKAFGTPPDYFQVPMDEHDEAREESKRFVGILGKMVKNIREYQSTGDMGAIRRFEKGKDQASELKGIGAFWSAVLNIRLNSIPLLVPKKGLMDTAVACENLAEKIIRALA